MNAKGICLNDHECPNGTHIEPPNATWKTAWSIRRASLLSLGCLLIFMASGFAVRVYRVKQNVRALEQLNANYAWQNQVIDHRIGERPNQFQRSMARWLGNDLVSSISRVRITQGNPSDEELRFVTGLRQLISVDIVSDAASDTTIAALADLPNLRCLSLVGRNFSVMGLLQLRNARNLCQLKIDANRFSPIELAVLRSELPIPNAGETTDHHYQVSPGAVISPMI